MTLDTKSPSLTSLLTLLDSLKRDGEKPVLTASERAARVSSVMDKLAAYAKPATAPLAPAKVQATPITFSAEDR